MSPMPEISIHNLTVSYQRRPAVHHVTGRFEPECANAIFGPNGAGKSTLLKAIAGLIRIDEGEIHRAHLPQTHIAYLPQASEIDRSQPMTVLDLVLTGCWARRGLWSACTKEDIARCIEALARVGLIGFERRAISELSGGQFQRILFARLMVQDAPVILLDEPFNSIDQQTTHDLLNIIETWTQEKRTVIAVLHDAHLVQRYFSHTLLLAREVVAWGETAAVLTAEHLDRAARYLGHWVARPQVCETDELG